MRRILTFLFLTLSCHLSLALKTLLYVDYHAREDISAHVELLKALRPYANKIDILAPSVYVMDKDGEISHDLAQSFIDWAHQSHVLLMPLVINRQLDQKLLHTFLNSQKAQEKAIQSLLALCQKNKYYGIQLDFENLRYSDRDKYTQFVRQIAQVFHQNQFKLSVAVVPPAGYDKPPTAFQTAMYINWVGGYDYARLAQAADFLSVMTYDHHTSETTPGAIASADWMEQTIQFLLPLIPADKFSLGVPTYSGHWFTSMGGGAAHATQLPLSYASVVNLLEQFKANLSWDPVSKTHYAIFVNHSLNEYLFIEDAASFKAKYNLAKKYHLRGISIWQFSFSDPAMWQLMPERTSVLPKSTAGVSLDGRP